jgi:hypothetical protein
MNPSIDNRYGARKRASAYAELEFSRTNFVAFRELPERIGRRGGADRKNKASTHSTWRPLTSHPDRSALQNSSPDG